jgi:hypothetical protein
MVYRYNRCFICNIHAGRRKMKMQRIMYIKMFFLKIEYIYCIYRDMADQPRDGNRFGKKPRLKDPVGFLYLKGRPDSLLENINYVYNENQIIIKDNSTGLYKHYQSYRHFEHYNQLNNTISVDEVILPTAVMRFRADIDNYTDAAELDMIVFIIETVILAALNRIILIKILVISS